MKTIPGLLATSFTAVLGILTAIPMAQADCRGKNESFFGCTGGVGFSCIGTFGPNVIRCNRPQGCVISGLGGDDVIIGSNGDDTICGNIGDDIVLAEGGNDEVSLGFGADAGVGGAGTDNLDGDFGRDLLVGGPGIDFLNGGFGFFDVCTEGGPNPPGCEIWTP